MTSPRVVWSESAEVAKRRQQPEQDWCVRDDTRAIFLGSRDAGQPGRIPRAFRQGRLFRRMSRRKGEITARMNERNCPHIVELPLPSGGFRAKSDDILAFHRERGIEPQRFGGERLISPPPRGRARG
jgi:hypothetical protein